jgi:nitroreductase
MQQQRTARVADHPVDRLFLDRWSPRAMSGEPIDPQELMILFEAARWAPSSFNEQPWRILYAPRSSRHWPEFLDLLIESNRAWAQCAAVLLVLLSKKVSDRDGQESITHSFDTGAAWENLALQASLRGHVAHAMQGFDHERARRQLAVPENYRLEAMVAIGRPGSSDQLPEKLRAREQPNGRRPLAQTICEGPFSKGM